MGHVFKMLSPRSKVDTVAAAKYKNVRFYLKPLDYSNFH